MSKKYFTTLAFIKKLLTFSPRQFEGETKTAEYIMSVLDSYNILYKLQYFTVKLPYIKKANLYIDGKPAKAEGCCFVSGNINNKDKIISSLLSSRICQNDANINFNPKCPKISKSNHYFAPALSVTHKTLAAILKAKKIIGRVVIRPIQHKSVNILVGNFKNPKYICFAHYDSIKKGAIDNASGVAIMMEVLLTKPETLKNTLYNFSANEELSYDRPIYYGHGYRVFEKKYHKQLTLAKKIIIIECVGNGKPIFLKSYNILKMGFPIVNLKKWQKKIKILTANFEHLMTVYHSDLDDGRGIKSLYLNQAREALLKEIKV